MFMRKFYVTFKKYYRSLDYDYGFDSIIITLNEGEKPNLSTFEDKLNRKFLDDNYKEIMSWSLIEE